MLNRTKSDDIWTYVIDNNFAWEFLRTNQPDILSEQPALSQLCGACNKLSFWGSCLYFRTSQLRKTAETCGLCGTLWQYLDSHQASRDPQEVIELFKEGSTLRIGGYDSPCLRICMDLGM